MKVYKSLVSKYFSEKTTLESFLTKLTKLNASEQNEVATKGGVWIQKNGRGKILRIRSLHQTISPEDLVQVNFDPRVLSIPEVSFLECVHGDDNYSIWIKPAGVVAQGSQASDHASVLRYVEKYRRSEVYLIHRIDRETQGLMIVGHHSKAAALLSELFTKNKIKKVYEAIVLGEMKIGHQQTINAALDDMEAITHFTVIDSKDNQTLVKVQIQTGRLHQIRRHMDLIGHPIIGDPKYGKGNKNRNGLKLIASSLEFLDPWSKKSVTYTHPTSLHL